MKRIRRILAVLLCVFLFCPAYTFAASEQYTIHIGGYLSQSDAQTILKVINDYRSDKGLKALVWENSQEEFLTNRAAELSIDYSFTRLNGKTAREDYHGYIFDGTSIDKVIRSDIRNNTEFQKDIENPDLLSFCGAVFKSDDGDVYYAYSMYFDRTVNATSVIYKDDYYDFPLKAKDKHLNVKKYFTNTTGTSLKGTKLRKGKKYYFYLLNYNEKAENSIVELTPLYAKSSNTDVAKISNNGIVTPTGPGVATLTIRPAKASGLTFKKKVIVRPTEVTSVKASSTKKRTATVTWAKQKGVSGYQIYRSTKKDSGFKLIKTISGASTKTFTDAKRVSGRTYYYKVRGFVRSNDKKYPGPYSEIVKCKMK